MRTPISGRGGEKGPRTGQICAALGRKHWKGGGGLCTECARSLFSLPAAPSSSSHIITQLATAILGAGGLGKTREAVRPRGLQCPPNSSRGIDRREALGRDRHGCSLSVSPSCRLTPAPDLSAAHPFWKARLPPNPILTLRTEQLEASESNRWLLPLPSQGSFVCATCPSPAGGQAAGNPSGRPQIQVQCHSHHQEGLLPDTQNLASLPPCWSEPESLGPHCPPPPTPKQHVQAGNALQFQKASSPPKEAPAAAGSFLTNPGAPCHHSHHKLLRDQLPDPVRPSEPWTGGARSPKPRPPAEERQEC